MDQDIKVTACFEELQNTITLLLWRTANLRIDLAAMSETVRQKDALIKALSEHTEK